MSEIDKIDFTQVKETRETLIVSDDNQWSFVTFEGETPSSIETLQSKSPRFDEIAYNHFIKRSPAFRQKIN
jgi:hypothetical protein